MENCAVGIVLSTNPRKWASIVPHLLIYETPDTYEHAIHRLIDRQFAFKHLSAVSDFDFTLVAIILDGIDLSDMDLAKVGVDGEKELEGLLHDLSIKVFRCSPDSFVGKRLFPLAWDWSIGKVSPRQIRSLSRGHYM